MKEKGETLMSRGKDDINVMIVEADKHPYMAAIPDKEGILGNAIGGNTQVLELNEEVGIVYDVDGYERGREPNRILFNKDGEPEEILCGTFAVVGMEKGCIASLTIEKAGQYFSEFYEPTFFGIDYDREVTYSEYAGEYQRNAFGCCEKEIEEQFGRREMEAAWDDEREFWR